MAKARLHISVVFLMVLGIILLIIGSAMVLGLGLFPSAPPERKEMPTEILVHSPGTVNYPIYILDSRGRSIQIVKNPQRIIAFDSAAVEILFALGSGNQIVGTHDFVSYPPEGETITRIGDAFNLNVETIVALDPDMFVTFLENSVDVLEQLGIPVLYLAYPETLNDMPTRIRIWGQIVDRFDEAELLAENFEKELIRSAERLRMVVEGPRIFHDAGELWTTGDGTFVSTMYSFLKAENIARELDGWAQISQEQILEKDPEIIVLAYPQGPNPFTENPALRSLTAVKNGRVYHIDPDLLSIPGPRIIEGLRKLATYLYPQLFNDVSKDKEQ